jgi:hypothetical protein
MSAEDEALLEQEQAATIVTALMPSGATLVPARGSIPVSRACSKVLAIAIRPDVEVVTDVYRQTLARMAEAMGIPLLDPKVDDPPHCDACCDAGR